MNIMPTLGKDKIRPFSNFTSSYYSVLCLYIYTEPVALVTNPGLKAFWEHDMLQILACPVHDGRRALAAHHCVEAVDGVGRVVHDASGAVGVHHRVLAGHHVAVPGLGVALGVPGHGVLDGIAVAVLGVVVERLGLLADGEEWASLDET